MRRARICLSCSGAYVSSRSGTVFPTLRGDRNSFALFISLERGWAVDVPEVYFLRAGSSASSWILAGEADATWPRLRDGRTWKRSLIASESIGSRTTLIWAFGKCSKVSTEAFRKTRIHASSQWGSRNSACWGSSRIPGQPRLGGRLGALRMPLGFEDCSRERSKRRWTAIGSWESLERMDSSRYHQGQRRGQGH